MKTNARRTLAVFIVLCLLSGLIPAAAIPAAAAPAAVEYDRRTPEVAILNANTGYDAGFYEKLKLNYGKDGCDYAAYYNGIGLFRSSKYPSPDYRTRVNDDDTGEDGGYLYFKGSSSAWASSTLHSVAVARQNLAANLSATLYNRVHAHKCGLFKSQDVLAFEKVHLFLGNTWASSIYGSTAGMSAKYPRLGDYTALNDSYTMLDYTKSFNAFLKFEKSSVKYEKGICTCGGAYAENMLVTFRDSRAPALDSVYFSVDGGTEQRSNKQMHVGAQQTLTIRLHFDEPIRFADDSAAHGDLSLILRARGVTGDALQPKAALTRLDGNDLYFTYTVRGDEGELSIPELGLSGLYGKNLPLVQVIDDKSFTLSETAKNGDKTGFSETSAYITDLAGNPIVTERYNCSLRIDTTAPSVTDFEFVGYTGNEALKAALGKTDPDDLSYPDASDAYLGEGDSLQITAILSETTNLPSGSKYWPNAVAVTNIIVDGDLDCTLGGKTLSGLGTREVDGVTYLTVDTVISNQSDSGTNLVFALIPIHKNLRVADADGDIRVTAFAVKSGHVLCDLAGNLYAGAIAENANANPYKLDVTPPTAEGVTYTKVGDGFRYGFTIADDASGAAGIPGCFVLNNGGDGAAYPYEYVISAEPETPTAGWTRAAAGTAVDFTQVECPPSPAEAVYNYLFVRPVTDGGYADFSGVTLTVRAADYAGNVGETLLPASGVFDFAVDGLAPTAKAGAVTRTLSGATGTLTVEVTLADKSGVAAWQYSTDDGATWQDGDITGTPTTFVGKASFTAANGESVTRTILIRATDTAGNISDDLNIGSFTYDLSKAQYALHSTEAVTVRARLSLTSLAERDTVVVAVPIPADVSGAADTYAVLTLTDWDQDKVISNGKNLFEYPYTAANGWYYMTMTAVDEGNIRYRFDADADTRTDEGWYMPKKMYELDTDSAVYKWWSKVIYGGYSGSLEVLVIAGAKTSFTRFASQAGVVMDTLYAVKVAGSDSGTVSTERIRLRTLSELATEPYAGASLTAVTAGLTNAVTGWPWSTSNETVPATLEGVQLRLVLERDNFGWGYENIDTDRSYLLIRHRELTGTQFNYDYEYRVPLAELKPAADGSAAQIITIPAAAQAAYDGAPTTYETGGYELSVRLARRSGDSVDTVYFDGLIEVDATEPVANRGFLSFRANPMSDRFGAQYNYWDAAECLGDGVIYLPTAGIDSYDFAVGAYSDSSEDADGNVTYSGVEMQSIGVGYAANPEVVAQAGVFTTVIWNTAAGYADHKVELRQYDRDQSIFDTEKSPGIDNLYRVEVSAMPASPEAYTLYLAADADNRIAVQQVYANGRRSDIVYRTVHPVGGDYTGTLRADTANGGELIFTPDANNTYTGLVRVYAGVQTADGQKYRTEMAAQADGTYRMPLVARETGGATYTVTAEDDCGNIFMAAGDAPVQLTQKAPTPDIGIFDKGDGAYSIGGHIYDPSGDYTIRLEFDEAYAALLPESSLTFHIAEDGTNDFAFTALGGTGVYRVETSYTVDRTMLNFYLHGVVPAGTNGFTAKVSMTDAYGYTGEGSDTCSIVGVEPQFENFSFARGNTVFNQPVRPADTFIWQSGDSHGKSEVFPYPYDAFVSREWEGAFTITENGTQEISYYDVFGRLYTATVDVGTAFYHAGEDESIHIEFSETGLTGEAVTLTTAAVEGTLLVFEKTGADTYVPLAPIDGDARTATLVRRTVIRENAELYVCRYDIGDEPKPDAVSGISGASHIVRVYITNIANRAPQATVYYYLEAAGREFTAEELTAYIAAHGEGGVFESRGAVTARYHTSRTVTPTAGGSEYTFTAGGERTHTFAYVDDFGNTGSVTAALPEGLVVTGLPKPYVDTEAPEVAVDIYAKRAGVLSRAEAFRAGETAADIAEKFADVGEVQGYSLRLNISDKSMPCTVSVTAAAGVSLSGSVLSVDAAADFTVTVTDAVGNAATLTFPAALFAKIDSIAPRAETKIVMSGMYTRDGYVRPYDVDATGAERTDGSVSLTFSTDAVAELLDGKLWYRIRFADNGSVTCVFRDAAGNYGEAVLTVSDIDTSAPTLTQKWSPAYAYTEDGIVKYDESRPTAGPTKNSVSTHLDSDMPLAGVTVTPKNGYTYSFAPGDGVQDVDAGVSVFVTEARITVTYAVDYNNELTIEAMAGNGRTTTRTLGAFVGVIDTAAPRIAEVREPLFRTGSSVPYGYRITLTPDEDAYCQNYGTPGDLLSPLAPFVWEVTANETRDFRFADKAGNLTVVTVAVDDLDYTAPTLTVTYPGGDDAVLELPTSGSVSITVKADEDCTLTVGGSTYTLQKDVDAAVTFTENGTYTMTATDAAGNTTAYTLTVSGIDHTLPTISFDTNTVFVTADAAEDALRALLDTGYTVWDNVTLPGYPQVAYDLSGVDLTAGGLYEVPYTVTDAAGNTLDALRFVRVIGKDTLCLTVDGAPVLPGGTAVLRTGAHALTVENLPEIEPGICEPYYIRLRRGIFAAGQMKYRAADLIPVASSGSFTLTEAGYYTLILTTQSRQTIRVLLYVEN